ncbi:unnamed protein product [Enterobius vermicularis]|uniref:Chitin-binding type-2 domain-containing protein n=1 Tax=Enterobius vermicularis TaxID=51028 RepID=A0A0N4UZ25_ENTVE|nr:unnamed protein product [Enterobius vermicularis]
MFEHAQFCRIIAVWVLIVTVAEHLVEAEYMRGCYFTNWARYRTGRCKFSLDTYQPGMCTHVFYAFAKFNYDFEAEPTDPEDLPSSYYIGTYATVTNLKKIDPDLKISLSFGGYSFGGYLFGLMASTETNRQKFISSAIEFARRYKFDGIDIDWEYPSANEKQLYVLFIKELRDAVEAESESTKQPRLLVTAAVPAGKATIDTGYDVAALAPYMDYFLVMTYDYHGSWNSYTGNNSPLFARENQTDKTFCDVSSFNAAIFTQLRVEYLQAWTMNYYASLGAPKNQLIMGFPNYGRGWMLRNRQENYVGAPANGPSPAYPCTQTAGIAAYLEICEVLAKPGVQDLFNEEQEVPYFINGDEWMSYDDVESVRIKAEWARNEGFGGGFVWTLDFDDFNGQCPGNSHPYPLTRTMGSVFSNGQLPSPVPTVAPSTSRPTVPAVTATTVAPPQTSSTAAPGVFTCPGDGLYADPTNCNRFYQCTFGQSYLLSCPPGLHFSPLYKVCDFAGNVSCKV